jgi:ketosteroid isomerase-like protein
MHTRGCTVSEMRNGRIIHSITYTDQLALLHQLTTPPKSASAD